MPDIRAMCAIGRRGQLGLNGRMPWEGAKGPEYTADVQRFFELTRGHVILLGPRTYRSVPTFAHEDRTVVGIRSSEQPADVIARYPDRVIYIGGGPPVWTAYAPFIRHWDITRLPYDSRGSRGRPQSVFLIGSAIATAPMISEHFRPAPRTWPPLDGQT